MSTIPTVVKIPSLLAQYLYNFKQLDLPGIGTFVLDNSAISSVQNSKQRQTILEGVSFVSKPAAKESGGLIEFIAEKTGKMKSLASSDLESHLQLALQFLNMGKPYLFEGIGILTKLKTGEYEFTSIAVATDKIKELNTTEDTQPVSLEESSSKYDTFLSGSKTKVGWQRPVVAAALILGIGLTVWGGYIISKKNKQTEITTTANEQTVQPVANTPDTSVIIPAADMAPATTQVLTPENYKYVLEVARKKRALKRYNQLIDIRWKVQMETKDSVQYTLFMLLPAISDTTRTLDSLTAMTGRKVYIEYSN
ncbi:hypothetical protein [Terrimonas pollutisoli]|uniref:hypothetical protein n=1 Tax=Terrimonas pollutisoli TaxID=3034147 RepID=UPI0023EB39BA|nr:hypothetical protein [Terrimonas sp. H1YJ31]